MEKLATIIARNYIFPGLVMSLADFFEVEKVDDIWLVYNGSICGLNAALWAPHFWLPYPRSAVPIWTWEKCF
jgi:hypothetical protein